LMLSAQAIIAWCAGVCGAASLKMASSIDDVVWLAPFLTSKSSWHQRFCNSVIYTIVCMTQTLVAFIIAVSGDAAVDFITRQSGAKDVWSTEKILTVAAGTMLAIYAVKLTYEYVQEYKEGGNDADKKPDENFAEPTYALAATVEEWSAEEMADVEGGIDISKIQKRALEIDGSPEKGSPAHESKEADGRSQTLFIVAFIGSLDDLTLFVPMLVGKGFNIAQLMLGSLLAVVTIVLICIFLGLCKPFADFVEKIPLALIVVIFATYLLGKACWMD